MPKESPLKFLEDKFAALEIKISLQIDNIIQTLQQENERLKMETRGNTKEQLTLVEKDFVELQQHIRRNHVEVVGKHSFFVISITLISIFKLRFPKI